MIEKYNLYVKIVTLVYYNYINYTCVYTTGFKEIDCVLIFSHLLTYVIDIKKCAGHWTPIDYKFCVFMKDIDI